MQSRGSPAGRIVVGVDGSPSSKAALRWAVRQAGLTGSTVDAVIAWHNVPTFGEAWAPVGVVDAADLEQRSTQLISDAVSEALDPASAVHVTVTVREGAPAQVIVNASSGADLLVVGSRGHGGFTGALLGSVSQYCAQHARCPVVIIRGAQ